MTKKLLILSILLLISIPSFAQPVHTDWINRYDGSGNDDDYVWAIAVDDWGNIYVTGSSWARWTYEDYTTIKYYPNGDTAWVRRYNGSVNGDDVARAIVVDGSGNIYVTGWSWGGSSTYDYVTIKYDTLGNELWVRRYNGSGNYFDIARDIAVDSYNNAYVTGLSYDSLTGMDYTTIKYDSNGNEIWVRRYNGSDDHWDFPNTIVLDIWDNIYVTGQSHQSQASAYNDYATVKYYPNGDTAWVRRYGRKREDDVAWSLAIDSSSNVYVTGNAGTIKYNEDGDQLWISAWCGIDIGLYGASNIYVTGGSHDFITIKGYPDGVRAWLREYNGSENEDDIPLDMIVDDYGYIYVTGQTYNSGTFYDYTTIKYDSSGTGIWIETYGQTGNYFDCPRAIAVDDFGNVYVTGWSYNILSGYDYVTIKYAQDQVFIAEEKQIDPANSFNLEQNYPNPFNPQTTIRYTLDLPSKMSLKIYNIKGQLVKILIEDHQEKGEHTVTWNGTNEKGENTSSGVYFYQLKTTNCILTKKMLKLR